MLSGVRSLYLCEWVRGRFQQYTGLVGITTAEHIHVLARVYWEDRWCIFGVDFKIMIAIDWNFRYRDSLHFRLSSIPVPVFRWNIHALVRGNDARSPRHFLPPVFGRHKWKSFLAFCSSVLYNTFLGAEKRACRPIFVLNSWRRVTSVIILDLDTALVGLHQLVVVIRGI